jgi:beta-1,4-N-acetylglucosaminyltransferase
MVAQHATQDRRRAAAAYDTSETVDVLLVCSAGGHFFQLMALRAAWGESRRLWVTLRSHDTASLLGDERVVYAHAPTTRSIKNLLRNTALAWTTIRRARPAVVLTTGAGVSVPFAWIGRLHGARIVFVESITRIDRLSLSARLIQPVAERIYVQWPELATPRGPLRYSGSVLTLRWFS